MMSFHVEAEEKLLQMSKDIVKSLPADLCLKGKGEREEGREWGRESNHMRGSSSARKKTET